MKKGQIPTRPHEDRACACAACVEYDRNIDAFLERFYRALATGCDVPVDFITPPPEAPAS